MMQQVALFSMAVDPRVGEELKHHWRRFVVLGAALIVLGVVALGSVGIATITSVLVFGWILVVAGILETIHAWRVRGWSGSSTGRGRESSTERSRPSVSGSSTFSCRCKVAR